MSMLPEPHEDRDRQKWQQPKNSNKLFPSISRIELAFYFISFWSGCFYSLYRFYRTSQRWGQYLPVTPIPDSWLGTRQDQTDLEWFVWVPIILSYAPWGFVHVVISQLIRRFCPQHLCNFYIGFSVCITVPLIGRVGTALCFAVPSIMFVVLLTRLKLIIWLTWCLILILFNTQFFTNYVEFWVEDIPEGVYKVSVMVAWIILRSLSFSLEICDTDPESKLRPVPLLTMLFGYCLYLPFLCTGPYMPFTDFKAGLAEPYRIWTLRRFIGVGLQIMRFLWWMGFTQFLLYQFFAHSLHFTPELVKKMSSWSMAGFVYFLTAFLQLKYVVLYGLPSVLARVEGYDPPRHPRCTLMTYRFSDIWRYFDHGLYRFMLKHIYIPWVGFEPSLVRQLQGTALVFTFVYVWHGVSTQVFWWATINFFGVVAEKLGDSISRMPTYEAWESRWFPGSWQRRILGLLAVCLYVPSLTALVIFLSNLDNALVIGNRIFISGFPQCTLSTFFFMFCLGQCSMELQNWKIRQKLELKQS
ncbi:protein-cysteine N-palmitoyltransferase HHAT isoform X2 [Procambarus clarkii]|nr:protein-cysteine N-palmitoyltransferase HHAT-like [Procambarus clarkii]XP_045584584.1 protein-cysteine N-palmitoyltransferase HHAT-like [Procambarus clarkii]XP_045584585.1 protein-cysteine N-palmitoyltransferase HHAT-like [Procambarus clarkii]XP_045584586.1 protein-cysteine N-palmitoyltransferase HHAT-like [Procambarus clarkii]